MRMRRLVVATFFVLVVQVCIPAERVTIYGHRGARGLAPENTIPAVQVALDHHVDAVDLDVVMTKDGVLVAYHGLTLNSDTTRDANGRWVEGDIPVRFLTLKQLKTYDVGRINPVTSYAAIFSSQIAQDYTSVPTLQEVIQYVKSTADYPVGFQIEIKTNPTKPELSELPVTMMTALNRIINEEGIANRTKVQAYDWQCLLLLQQLNPTIKTAYLTDVEHEKALRHIDTSIAGRWTGGYLLKDYHDSIPEMIHALGGTWWDVLDVDITPELVQKAHQLGLKIAAWSWPEYSSGKDVDIELVKKLIALRVDGIITDRPDVVRALLLK